MKRRKQPDGLARAREQRKRAELDARAVIALERIADAFERFPDRFALFLMRAPVPVVRKGQHDAT